MTSATLKAYIVTEENEGHASVEFARHAIAARRVGANELDTDFEYVTCRRAPVFDEYAPGPVPALVIPEGAAEHMPAKGVA